jgi:hypothetical protein
MSIFYVFVINDPNNVGAYPPSIPGSEYANKIGDYFESNSVAITQVGSSTFNFLSFENKTALDSWLAEHTLSDASIISDLNTWKSAHGVSFQSYYLDTANSTAITGPVS